jgi:5-methylcytosine-specific restriction endonuclease McrA
MSTCSFSHFTDHGLLCELATTVSQDRNTTSRMLALIAEVDVRKLYLPAGYSSMYLYCVHELRMSEDVAYKRIRAARAARQFPAILPLLADGRLSLSAVLLLTPHLTPDTADELLAGAEHKTNAQVELLLAERFPMPDVPTLVRVITPVGASHEPAAGTDAPALQLAVRPVVPSVGPDTAVPMGPLPSRAKPAPLSPGRYAVQFTMDEEMHEELRKVQALLGQVLPSGDVMEVFRRALRELRVQLEKRKFAKSDRPRRQSGAAKGRHIPAAVKRAVVERDGGQCTFVSDKGKRCDSRTRLELDHVEPVARGGEATADNLRLRCRAHNQYAAELVYGEEFMSGKREAARDRTAKLNAHATGHTEQEKPNRELEQAKAQAAAEFESQQEVIPWLRALGCNIETARRAAARCAGMVGVPLERRVRVAVQSLGRLRRAGSCQLRAALRLEAGCGSVTSAGPPPESDGLAARPGASAPLGHLPARPTPSAP